MLDNLADFDAAIQDKQLVATPTRCVLGEMHCPPCGGERRMMAFALYPRLVGHGLVADMLKMSQHIVLVEMHCVQCDTQFLALRYPYLGGYSLAVVSIALGGISTPATPPAVAYYLDQAHKAHSVGANSAAVAMYRAALEQLLYEQGFTTGMLNQKIVAFEAAITSNTAPKWAADLDTDYLRALKDLGNGSIHTNGGDVTKQAQLDGQAIAIIKAIFAGLLQIVYEIPKKKAADLAALKKKVALLK